MNRITPKETFLEDDKRADRHMEVVLNPEFRGSLETSLLEYAMNLDVKDPFAAARLDGAREVVKIILNLGEPNMPSPPKKYEGLKAI